MGLYNLEQLSEKLEALQPLETLKEVIADHEREAINLNQSQMFDLGINAYGESLGQYAPETIKKKQKKGDRTDHVTGFDTGSMFEAMYAKTDNRALTIGSTSATAEPFTEGYLAFYSGSNTRKDAFGLTKDNEQVYAGVILPPFYQRLRQKMGI